MTVNCEGLSTRLEEILESDDKARLVNLLRDQPTDIKIINSLVEECVESGASKCLIALIRGEVCNIHPTFNAGKLPDSRAGLQHGLARPAPARPTLSGSKYSSPLTHYHSPPNPLNNPGRFRVLFSPAHTTQPTQPAQPANFLTHFTQPGQFRATTSQPGPPLTRTPTASSVGSGSPSTNPARVQPGPARAEPARSPALPDSGMTALAYVAHSCPDPEVINLMLTKCGGGCLANVSCTIGLVHGLPIHFVLINLSVMEHLFPWYRGTPLLKLVFLLCHWETKPILDSLRVLVKYTDSINDIAWTILKNGGLRQFTALLLIAREKVIAPFDTGFTIHQYITAEIESFREGKLDYEQEEYKCIFRDALTLLDLFEKAGDDLSSYCSSMQEFVPGKQVVIDVSTLLIKNKVIVGYFALNLADCAPGYNYWPESFIQTLESMVEIDEEDKFVPKEAIHRSNEVTYTWARPMRSTSMPIPKHACLQQRLYTTGACQARKMSKYSLHTGVGPFPRHLGYITLKFINKARFL